MREVVVMTLPSDSSFEGDQQVRGFSSLPVTISKVTGQ